MNRNLDLIAGPATARGSARPALPVLIQVPALAATPRRSPRPAGRRRRRLRREVRVAGAVMMLLAGPSLLGLMMARGGNAPVPAADAAFAAAARSPVISILVPVETATTNSIDLRAPVIRPGTIVPEDGPEEPAHAGS